MILEKSLNITSPFQLVNKAKPIPKISLDLVRRFVIKKKEEEDHQPLALKWLEKALRGYLVVTDSAGEIHIFDSLNNEKVLSDKIEASWLYCFDSDPEKGETFAVGSLSSNLHIYKNQILKHQKIKKTMTLNGHRGAVKCAKFLTRNYIISGSSDSQVGIWDLNNSSRHLSMLQGHMSDIESIDVSELDKNIFLTGSSDLSAKIWDIRLKNPEVFSFIGGKSCVTAVRFMPRCLETFATSSDDSCIRLFDLRAGDNIHILCDNQGYDPVQDFTFSTSGRLIFAATKSKELKIWDTLEQNGRVLSKIDLQAKNGINSVSLSYDGGDIACASFDGVVSVLSKNVEELKKQEFTKL